MDDGSYKELYEFAHQLAEQAGQLILKGSDARWTSNQNIGQKKNSVDPVTETDQAVEMMIKSAVARRYPDHKFIGEESYEAGEQDPLTDAVTWIVDPIDGTMNFVHSNPFVACSIGITHKSKPVVGVIAQPFLKRTISAFHGGGAWLDRTIPLPLTGGKAQALTDLSSCMIAAEWGSDRNPSSLLPRSTSFLRLLSDPKTHKGGLMIHSLRRATGSSACNIAAVAAGEMDIYWDAGCWPWDVCAGAIILSEVGGYFAGGKDSANSTVGEIIMGRRYMCIRAVAPTKTESAAQIQSRLAKELYEAVDEWKTLDMA